MSHVDAAQAQLTTIPQILKRFRQSVLAAACSGRLTADWRSKTPNITQASDSLRPILKRGLLAPQSHEYLPGWAVCSVDELFESYGGGTPSRRNLDYWNGEVVWISSGDVKTDIIESSSETITKVGLENSSANLCDVGAVLVVVRSGILKHTLPVALAGTSLAINQDIKCLDSANVKLNYWLFLNLKAAAQDILAFNREGTTLKNFELSIPPLEEQEEIVRRIEAIFKTADALESRYYQAKAYVDKLTQSILHKAFRGELVPQDKKDEPAAVLLERIRSERASHLVPPKVVARAAQGVRATKTTPHSKGIFYRRAALDCYVIEKLEGDPNLGRTKMEKISHLLEHHCGIDLEREPVRDAAGPNDYPSRINVESLARKQEWYSTRTREGGAKIDYLPGPEILKARRTAINFLGYRKTKVDRLLSLLRPLDTKKAEVVATLYASWNDFLLTGKTPTEDELINDVRNNWHPAKQLIPIESWIKALGWMRRKELVPTGTGKPVTHKPNSGGSN
jgi:hypothetical protein